MLIEIPVENKHQLITLPVVKSIATTILRNLGSNTFTEVLLQSEISGVKTQQDPKDVTLKGNRVLNVTFEEHTTRDSQAMGLSSQVLTPPVLDDSALGFNIHAVHASSELIITLRGESSSRNEVKHIWDSYFSRINQDQETVVHDVAYRYELPLELIQLIAHIYGLRETQYGWGDTLKDYILVNASVALDFTSNAAGSVGGIAIEETQTRIPGSLRPVVHDQENFKKDRETGMYEYSVECRLVINMPIMFRVSYPIMVHQQLLDAQYVPPAYTDQYNIQVPHTIYGFMTNFERPRLLSRVLGDVTVRIPKEDSFTPGWPDQPDLVCLATILTTVTPGSLELLSLKDLGDFMIAPDVLRFILDYPSDVLRFQESIIKINVYANNERLHDDLFVIEDGRLRLVDTPNPRVIYRVGLHVLNGLMLLSSGGWQALLKHPRVLVAIIGYIEPSYLSHDVVKQIYAVGTLTPQHRQWLQSQRKNFMRGISTGVNSHYADTLQPQVSPT